MPVWHSITSAALAEEAAANLGLPVCLKLAAPSALHKSDLGGVLLNLNSVVAVREGFESLKQVAVTISLPGRTGRSWSCRRLKAASKLLLAPNGTVPFGPMIVFGAGGIWVEVLEDVAMRLVPLDLTSARELIAETKIYKILKGLRGQPRPGH